MALCSAVFSLSSTFQQHLLFTSWGTVQAGSALWASSAAWSRSHEISWWLSQSNHHIGHNNRSCMYILYGLLTLKYRFCGVSILSVCKLLSAFSAVLEGHLSDVSLIQDWGFQAELQSSQQFCVFSGGTWTYWVMWEGVTLPFFPNCSNQW